ncbi:MAG: hypothetical protein JRI68_31450, partial [Deltaproteobacteria bacterium]|nr:hypothetical protein [Deltaproteobacteria bacterium]
MGSHHAPAIVLVALVLTTPALAAAQTPVRDWPCEGCWVQPVAPDGDGGRPAPPLLVLLHGDEGHPTKLFAAWRATAAKAQVVLFAPRCPEDGTGGRSWWRWNGDPEWLWRHTRSVAERHGTDPARSYLAGWSGGATYIGYRAAAWSGRFAAVSLAGGGAPTTGGHCPTCPYPVHHLMGDHNPLLSLAESATEHFRSCGQTVTWELLPHHSHSATWRSYATPAKLAEVLRWLQPHSTATCATSGPTPSGSGPSPSPPPTEPPVREAGQGAQPRS